MCQDMHHKILQSLQLRMASYKSFHIYCDHVLFPSDVLFQCVHTDVNQVIVAKPAGMISTCRQLRLCIKNTTDTVIAHMDLKLLTYTYNCKETNNLFFPINSSDNKVSDIQFLNTVHILFLPHDGDFLFIVNTRQGD